MTPYIAFHPAYTYPQPPLRVVSPLHGIRALHLNNSACFPSPLFE